MSFKNVSPTPPPLQMKAGAQDALDRTYNFTKSLTTPEKVEWLEKNVAELVELSREYWVWISELVVVVVTEGGQVVQEGALQAQTFITNNFIK